MAGEGLLCCCNPPTPTPPKKPATIGLCDDGEAVIERSLGNIDDDDVDDGSTESWIVFGVAARCWIRLGVVEGVVEMSLETVELNVLEVVPWAVDSAVLDGFAVIDSDSASCLSVSADCYIKGVNLILQP